MVQLTRPGFRRTAAEQAETETGLRLTQAIQSLMTVIAKLRDIGDGQVGLAQVVGKIVADQARLKADIAALKSDIALGAPSRQALDAKLDTILGNQTTLLDNQLKLDTIIATQATILTEIATTHP